MTRSDCDRSENCYLVGVGVGVGGGGGNESLVGGIFPGGGGMSKFSTSGGSRPPASPIPPVGKTLFSDIRCFLLQTLQVQH